MSMFSRLFGKKKRNVGDDAADLYRRGTIVFDKFPLYSSFAHSGISFTVIHHTRYVAAWRRDGLNFGGVESKLGCRYYDKIGVIHEIYFELEELENFINLAEKGGEE